MYDNIDYGLYSLSRNYEEKLKCFTAPLERHGQRSKFQETLDSAMLVYRKKASLKPPKVTIACESRLSLALFIHQAAYTQWVGILERLRTKASWMNWMKD